MAPRRLRGPRPRAAKRARTGRITPPHARSSHGNITNRSDLGDYTYAKANRPYQVTSVGDTNYGYDANGNQIHRAGSAVAGGNQDLDYDLFDMPRQIISGQAGAATTTNLQYGGDGARVLKRKLWGVIGLEDSSRCADNPSACLHEQTVDIGELYEQISQYAPGSCDQSAALDPQSPQACQALDRTHQYRVYAGGHQVAQVKRVEHSGGVFDNDRVLYLHSDRLGTTTAITDTLAQRVEVREFSAFGDPKDVNFSSSGTGVLSGFTGLEHDDGLGLINMRGRLYDPHLARFISADPFVTKPLNPQGFNRYSYVQNKPLNFTDPSGFDGQYGGDNSGAHPTVEMAGPSIKWPTHSAAPSSSGASQSSSSAGPTRTDAPSSGDVAAAGETADATAYAARHGIESSGSANPTGQSSSGGVMTGQGPVTISQSSQTTYEPNAQSVAAGSVGSGSGGSGGAIGLYTSYYNWNQTTGFILPYPGTSFQPTYQTSSYPVPVLSAALIAFDSSKTTSERVAAGMLGAVELGMLFVPGGAEVAEELEAVRRVATMGDTQFRTAADALAEALERYGIDPSSVETTLMYGKNPNLIGPKGQPWQMVRGLNSEGELIEFEHHSNGHFFYETKEFELPHYHGPNGEHLTY